MWPGQLHFISSSPIYPYMVGEHILRNLRKEDKGLGTPNPQLKDTVPNQKGPGVSNLLASLGHTGRRRVVSGHTLNTLQHVITQKTHNVLSKCTVLC